MKTENCVGDSIVLLIDACEQVTVNATPANDHAERALHVALDVADQAFQIAMRLAEGEKTKEVRGQFLFVAGKALELSRSLNLKPTNRAAKYLSIAFALADDGR